MWIPHCECDVCLVVAMTAWLEVIGGYCEVGVTAGDAFLGECAGRHKSRFRKRGWGLLKEENRCRKPDFTSLTTTTTSQATFISETKTKRRQRDRTTGLSATEPSPRRVGVGLPISAFRLVSHQATCWVTLPGTPCSLATGFAVAEVLPLDYSQLVIANYVRIRLPTPD